MSTKTKKQETSSQDRAMSLVENILCNIHNSKQTYAYSFAAIFSNNVAMCLIVGDMLIYAITETVLLFQLTNRIINSKKRFIVCYNC
jgi:hypothetical protein